MIEKMFFPVPLTDRELLTAANYSGMLSKTIAEKEAEFAEIKANHRESLRELKEALALQMDLLANKKETREVDVEILFNTPEKGKKTFRDPVTEEIWEIADMTEDDNEDLFVNAELSDEEEKEKDQSELSDQSKESELSDQSEELEESELSGESEKTLDECSICGSRANIYHVNYGKEICRKCMLEMPQEKKVKEMLDSGHPFLFRACAGYGNIEKNNDTTNFRFIDKSPEAQPKEPWKTRSWGMGIWRPGDYRKEGSEAYDFYMLLCCNPNGQEN